MGNESLTKFKRQAKAESVGPQPPKAFGRAEAEAAGLAVGKAVVYRKYIVKGKKEQLKYERTGTVWAMWRSGFVVRWDKVGYKERFHYGILRGFGEHEKEKVVLL